MAPKVFHTTIIMALTITLLQVSVGCLDAKRQSQTPVPKTTVDQIDKEVKRIIIKQTIPTLNDTTRELTDLVNVCEVKLNQTVESCNRCTRISCAASSQQQMENENMDLKTKAIQLLFQPLTTGAITLKVLESNLKEICTLLGPGLAKLFIGQFGDVAKDVSKALLKGANSIIKQSVKELVKFGEDLAKFAKDIGKGLGKSLKDITKGAVHISKQVLDNIKNVGSKVQKAAERTIKDATKAISKVTKKVGNLTEKVGKAAVKVVHHTVHRVVRAFRRVRVRFGKRSTIEKRRLEECQKVCPSCIKLNGSDAKQTLTKVCGADHTRKQDELMRKIKLNQRLLNITLTAASDNIVNMVNFDPTVYSITSGGVVYTDPIVTLNITGSVSDFVSNEPFNPMAITPFATDIIDELSQLI